MWVNENITLFNGTIFDTKKNPLKNPSESCSSFACSWKKCDFTDLNYRLIL